MGKAFIRAILLLGLAACILSSTVADFSQIVKPAELETLLDENRLSLVIFADKDREQSALKESGVLEAIKLLADDKQSIKIFMVDPKNDAALMEKHSLTSLPEFRMFWKGIPMLPPNLPKLTSSTIFRWIKGHIRASSYSNLREATAYTFFEKYKEKHPFIIIGLGQKDSAEARFLQEFSKNPRWTFATYIIQEKLAREIFQSIGLGSGKFNIILINNVGKVIKEYDGDLDYKEMWTFLMENTKRLGAVNIRNKENYIKDITSTGNPLIMLTLSDKSYRNLEKDFIKKMRTLSNEFTMNVVYGTNTPKLHENFEYNDCDKEQDCLYTYTNYLNSKLKKRHRFVLSDLDYKTLHRTMLAYKHAPPPQHFYSSSYRAPEIDEKFTVISRDNLQSFIDQKKDIFLLLYKYCGSNCHDKLKYMSEALKEFNDLDHSKIIFAVSNVSTNELPDELNVLSELTFKYRRAGEKSRWIDLPNYSSGYYIAKDVAKHASFSIRLKGDIEEDLEDLL